MTALQITLFACGLIAITVFIHAFGLLLILEVVAKSNTLPTIGLSQISWLLIHTALLLAGMHARHRIGTLFLGRNLYDRRLRRSGIASDLALAWTDRRIGRHSDVRTFCRHVLRLGEPDLFVVFQPQSETLALIEASTHHPV